MMNGKEKRRRHSGNDTNTGPSPLVSNHVQGHGDSISKKSKKNKRKKKSRTTKQDEDDLMEERRLTALLFGGDGSVTDEAADKDGKGDAFEATTQVPIMNEDSPLLFQLDRTGEQEEGENEQQGKNEDEKSLQGDNDDAVLEKKKDNDTTVAAPAWMDEDDDHVAIDLMDGASRLRKLRSFKTENVSQVTGTDYQQRLRNIYSTTTGQTSNTSWAQLKQQEQQHPPPLTCSTTSMLASSPKQLPPTTLSVVRCRDANQSDPSQSAVQAVHFFPSNEEKNLLLTAGFDKTLRFFQLSDNPDEPHSKIHGIHFPRLPIYSAQFMGDSGKVVVSGRRPFYYVVDVISGQVDCIPKLKGRNEKSLEKLTTSRDGNWIAFVGNDGYVLLVDSKSQQLVAELKLNGGSVRAIRFTPDSQYLYASGSDGVVYKFDVHTRSCVDRFCNQDGTITSCLAVSDKRLAVGAESGVVNLYKNEPKQHDYFIKSIMNLQTSVDALQFNHNGHVLAMASKREQNSLKLLHVPTATVFSNWPTTKTPLNYVWSMDFSPNSQYLAVANDKGKCLLYNLMHYNNNNN